MSFDESLASVITDQAIDCSIICTLDENLYITYCNQNFAELLDYTAEDLAGKSLIQLINTDNLSRPQFLASTLNNTQTFKGELQLRTRTGDIVWLDSIIKPVENCDTTHFIGFLTDSSSRKKLIDGLKQRAHRQGLIAILGQVSLSNISVADLLDQTLAVVCGSLDITAGIVLELSADRKTALTKAAYNAAQLEAGKTIIDVKPDNLPGFTLSSDAPVVSSSIQDEKRFNYPDELNSNTYTSSVCMLIGDKKNPFGELLLFSENTLKPAFDVINFLQSISNILAEAINRKRMEQSLKYEQALSQKYLDVADVLIIVMDKNETILLANQYASKVLGYTAEELAGMNFIDSFIASHSKDLFRRNFHLLFNPHGAHENSTNDNTIQVITGSNQLRTVKWRSSLVYDEHNSVTSVISAGEDITELLQQEAEQKKLEKQLNQAQRMEAIGMLTGGIAHDFNNILASILGFTELSLEHIPQDDKKLLGYLQQIHTSGIKARDIIEQIQNIHLQDEASTHAIMLPTLLKSTLKMLRSALPSSIDLRTEIEADLPAAYVNAARFNQLLMQLLINARDALYGKGKITIRLSQKEMHQTKCSSCHAELNSGYVVLSIEDNGPGVSADIINSLNADNDELPKSGLSLVNKILHMGQAHILIESASDTQDHTGTTVHMLFPVEKARPTSTSQDTQADLTSVQGKSVMIVDDENSVATYMGELFKSTGFKVNVYCDATEALSAFEQHPADYDLVITDQTMPGLTGDILASKMLALKPQLPIILCTGHSSLMNQQSAQQMNIQGFLKKPVDTAEILQMSVKLLSQSGSSPTQA